MLYVFGFERIGVLVGDLYFVDPTPGEGQEGPERGVRLELRMLARGDLKGSIYSAQPIAVDRPIWRVDLLESVAGPAGSFDRTHYHPTFQGWEPSDRCFVKELSAEPLSWVGERLSNLHVLLEEAGIAADEVDPGDAAELRQAVPEILDAVRRVLARVRAGELGRPPSGSDRELVSARVGWL